MWENRWCPGTGSVSLVFVLVFGCAKQVQKCTRRKEERRANRTYRRVGLLHRDAQGEDEQRHGELSQALQTFIHLGGNK